MVGERVVPNPAMDGLVRVARAFGAELPYRPAVAVAGVEVGDELVEGVAVGALRVGLRGAGAVVVGVRVLMSVPLGKFIKLEKVGESFQDGGGSGCGTDGNDICHAQMRMRLRMREGENEKQGTYVAMIFSVT
jgi:hypothetical protein